MNLVFNFLLVKRFGLYGIAISTAIGYVAVTLTRVKDAKREIGMSFDLFRTIAMTFVVSGQAVLTTVFQGLETYIFGFGALLVVAFLYRHEMKDILNVFANKFRR